MTARCAGVRPRSPVLFPPRMGRAGCTVAQLSATKICNGLTRSGAGHKMNGGLPLIVELVYVPLAHKENTMFDPRDLPDDVANILADAGYTLVSADDYEPTAEDLAEAANQ